MDSEKPLVSFHGRTAYIRARGWEILTKHNEGKPPERVCLKWDGHDAYISVPNIDNALYSYATRPHSKGAYFGGLAFAMKHNLDGAYRMAEKPEYFDGHDWFMLVKEGIDNV